MAEIQKIYLAGPDVFLEDAICVGDAKKDLCRDYGFIGLFPFDNEVHPGSGVKIDQVIYRANVDMIRSADVGIFNLTPFRGPSADVGTVFELGMMVALGKLCLAYTNSPLTLLDRMKRSDAATRGRSGDKWLDALSMSIEDFDNADNLMIDSCLRDGGFPIIRQSVPEADIFRDLSGFEACLDLLSRTLRTDRPYDLARSVIK